jgi:phosphohistidine phosphatase
VKLLVVRHAPAGDREEWAAEGRDDRDRPITPDGKKQMRRAVSGLATLVPDLDLLATSPLRRAVQSAALLADQYGIEPETLQALEPDRDPEELLGWLKEHPAEATLAIVGHEPHLSLSVSYLTTGKRSSFVALKKAGVVSLDFKELKPGGALVEWMLPPRALRRLAGK